MNGITWTDLAVVFVPLATASLGVTWINLRGGAR